MSETKQTAAANKAVAPKPDVYSIEDLCAAGGKLQASQDIIRAALVEQGKSSATYEEASAIVKNFKEREVKH